jgi:hypothetical protein
MLIHTHMSPAQFDMQSSLDSSAKQYNACSTYLNRVAFEIAVPREILLAQENELGTVRYVLLLESFFSLQCNEFAHWIHILDYQILLNFFRLFKS